ncbi:tryptophan-rich sensory protein [Halorussus gelatinilyticus]|uniref:Tryptophan-rich sensory protein n=1 Tax=Halorussus gelatinilyticus TaxID=2937524 RepID=A0A8U0IFL1_9EURY|nr:TspO/MBR family protein [Halorussus gelatinilyticus]UPV99001.1 tryptophan-rich sensory protein [Halorussus gelatinilyticus]
MNVTETLRGGDGEGIDWPVLLGSVVVCELAGIVPSILTADEVATWYPTLAKPAFTPPSWLFGPVWTTLYLLMGVALYLVWRSDDGRLRNVALAVFVVQLVLNAAWTMVFFGAQAILGGLVVILVLLAAILATMAAFARIDRRATALLVPYLLWVGFATALNYELWRLN